MSYEFTVSFNTYFFKVMQNLQNYLQTEDAKQQEAAMGVLQKQQVFIVLYYIVNVYEKLVVKFQLYVIYKA